MTFQFTHAVWLWALVPALGWIIWLARKSDVRLSSRRWRASLLLRLVVALLLLLALAGLQSLIPVEGMNVFYVMDRSDSIPAPRQEAVREWINRSAKSRKAGDKAGVIVFGTEAAIEFLPNPIVEFPKVQAVVGTGRSDLAGAIRLGSAAFPETGQKRLVLMTDGNENIGDALGATIAARQLGATVDVLPLKVERGGDVSLQRLQAPSRLKRGQPFEVKIFTESDRPREATVRLFRNEQLLGQQQVRLQKGRNLHTFPQTLPQSGFYSYDVQLDVPGDPIPQNNRGSAFTMVSGDPRILLVTADPAQDEPLAGALRAARLQVTVADLRQFPSTLAEMQSYDAIFISNLSAGDIGTERQKLLESAVRDFGVGLVCLGGDQAFAAGGYRGTPLESILPVSMELDSKKVLPSGAVVMVMHGMEFANGNQVARDCAQGVLAALGPSDEMGVVLWDGSERWLFDLQKVGTKKELARQIAGMNQGDLGSFQRVLEMAHEALVKSPAHLKHIIVFSDGDPQIPSEELMASIVKDRITVSTVLIAGHFGPQTMIWLAEKGGGRFYNITSPDELPQIFLKETAVILKSAIYEEPFRPQLRAGTEPVRGIAASGYPTLLGHVATTEKPRAETPLWTENGDPLLAHWQFGLGRAVAFTSDARARWGKNWVGWSQYRQFWSQTAQWSLRRTENALFTPELAIVGGEGVVSVDAVDAQGNYRNFLNLQAAVVGPKGDRQTVRLEQSAPGHYEARFPTTATGTYMANVIETGADGARSSQVVGASVNYSPEFNDTGPNMALLTRIAEVGGGRLLQPETPNPFLHDRVKTRQARDLWEWLLRCAILLFVFDVATRRIHIDREEWAEAWGMIRQRIPLLNREPASPAPAQPSLSTLLARREQVRAGSRDAATGEVAIPPEPTAPLKSSGAITIEPPATAPEQPSPPKVKTPASAASRLMAARRRSQNPPRDPPA